jgi:hypothetical protein
MIGKKTQFALYLGTARDGSGKRRKPLRPVFLLDILNEIQRISTATGGVPHGGESYGSRSGGRKNQSAGSGDSGRYGTFPF